MIQYQKGEIKKAIVNFEKTIEVYEKLHGTESVAIGNRYNNLGEAYRLLKKFT
jgi:hypothetical protein